MCSVTELLLLSLQVQMAKFYLPLTFLLAPGFEMFFILAPHTAETLPIETTILFCSINCGQQTPNWTVQELAFCRLQHHLCSLNDKNQFCQWHKTETSASGTYEDLHERDRGNPLLLTGYRVLDEKMPKSQKPCLDTWHFDANLPTNGTDFCGETSQVVFRPSCS